MKNLLKNGLSHAILSRLKRFIPEKPNVKIIKLDRISLRWLDDNNLMDALQCILSENEASTVTLVIAPCKNRRWPRKWRRLEERISLCERYESCSDPLTGKTYPDYPSTERCMRIEDGENCRIVYVAEG